MAHQPATSVSVPRIWTDASNGTPVARAERRANVRAKARLPIRLAHGRAIGPAQLVPVVMRNISTRGAGFVTRDRPVRLGEIVTLQVDFEHWVLRVFAIVRFHRQLAFGQQVGCEFVEMNAVDQQRIVPEVLRLIQSHTTDVAPHQHLKSV